MPGKLTPTDKAALSQVQLLLSILSQEGLNRVKAIINKLEQKHNSKISTEKL